MGEQPPENPKNQEVRYMKRFLWLCLVVTTLAALFAGCGDGGAQQDTSGAQQTTAAPETTVPVNLQEYEFVLYAADFPLEPGLNEMHDRWAADIEEIQQRLNCTINYKVSNGNNIEELMTAVVADNNLGDFVYCRHSAFFPLAKKDYIKPLDGEELVNAGFDVYDPEQWDQVYAQLSAFDGHIWGVQFNGEYFPCDFGDVVAFNPEITESIGYDKETLYNLVRSGDWTYEVFLDIAAKATKDLDGDGADDQWGMGNGVFQYSEMCATNGYHPIYLNDSGKIVADFTDPRYIEALTFVDQVYSERRPPIEVGAAKDARVMFKDGLLAFNQLFGPNFFEEPLISAEFDFGILPNPKGPQQEDYICLYPDCDAYVMLSCNKNVETSVLVMNELGAIMTNDGWKDRVKSAFRDEESWEIFETYIFPNMTLNMQNITGDVWTYIRENIVQEVLLGNKTPAQAVEGQNAKIQAMIDTAYGQ